MGKKRDYRLYEISFTDGFSMVIKGERQPTWHEAEQFCQYRYGDVNDVREVSEGEARTFFDCEKIDRWPIFSAETKIVRDLGPDEEPNWDEICPKCNDGEIEPRFCRYYGEPDGCNSPVHGSHPKLRTDMLIGEAARLARHEVRHRSEPYKGVTYDENGYVVSGTPVDVIDADDAIAILGTLEERMTEIVNIERRKNDKLMAENRELKILMDPKQAKFRKNIKKLLGALGKVRNELNAYAAGADEPTKKFLKKMISVLEKADEAPARNCDLADHWLTGLYQYFKAPDGIREIPPEWVDAISAFCKWVLAPATQKGGEQ